MLSQEIIDMCDKNKYGCQARISALETHFNCHIPTKVISGGNGDFMVSWRVIANIPQEILRFCDENNLEVGASESDESIFFRSKK